LEQLSKNYANKYEQLFLPGTKNLLINIGPIVILNNDCINIIDRFRHRNGKFNSLVERHDKACVLVRNLHNNITGFKHNVVKAHLTNLQQEKKELVNKWTDELQSTEEEVEESRNSRLGSEDEVVNNGSCLSGDDDSGIS